MNIDIKLTVIKYFKSFETLYFRRGKRGMEQRDWENSMVRPLLGVSNDYNGHENTELC
jgi:hypothetical protein